MSVPLRRLIKSLLWHLHGEGVGFAVLGLFLACLTGSFKQALLAGLYISTYGTPDFEMAQCVRNILSTSTETRQVVSVPICLIVTA
jgi:hypothetical protein